MSLRRDPKKEPASKIPRRAVLIGALQLAAIGALASRMRFLQVEEAGTYRLLAEENRINMRVIPPTRGRIFDRNGIALALNEQSYRLTLVPEDAGDAEHVLRQLQKLVSIEDDDIERVLNEARRSAPFLPITIADRISWSDVSKVAVNAPALPGVTPQVGQSRIYPAGPVAAHVAGYVGPVSQRDLDRLDSPDPVLRIPRFQVGKIGVEAQMETTLRGQAGSRRVEVNATGRVMRELERREGTPGVDLQLTLDAGLQNYILARLGDESASAVVMDIASGDLLAIASSPSFDPNKFVRGISSADYSVLRDDIRRPLATKTVQDAYPPGSTFKMVTALAALQEGLVTPDDEVYCPGHMDVSGRKFHCWRRGGHGRMNFTKALRESCDVYFYDIALRVGIDKINQIGRSLGLGQRFDLPMSAISGGLMPDRDWKQSARGRPWVVGDTVNASIGQGYVLASPLQLAVMTARLASGRAIAPRLIKSEDGRERGVVPPAPLPIDPDHLMLVREAMGAVCNDRRGTAYGSRIIDAQARMAGKTGTSQVRNISASERAEGVRRNDDLPWEKRDHALFVNFAPIENPKIAVCVVVEHGGGGSSAAAPIARDITLQALYGGPPPLSAYPAKDRAKIDEQQNRLRALQFQLRGDGVGRV